MRQTALLLSLAAFACRWRGAQPYIAARGAAARRRSGPLEVYPSWQRYAGDGSDSRHVVCLDFDGVIANTEQESATSAWMGMKRAWPELASEGGLWSGPMPPGLAKKLTRLRPIVGDEFENVLLCRLCCEEMDMARKSERGTRPLSVGEISANWGELKDILLVQYGGVRPEVLADHLAAARASWMADDPLGWRNASSFYPGVSEALHAREIIGEGSPPNSLHVVTTRDRPLVEALVDGARSPGAAKGSPALPAPSTELELDTAPPLAEASLHCVADKCEALMQIAEQEHAENPQDRLVIHYVDDRVELLETAAKTLGERMDLRLYVATWGYLLPSAEAKAAAMKETMSCIGTPELTELLTSRFVA